MADATPTPTQTPNVVVRNPRVRKVANWIIGSAAIALPIVVTVDAASSDFDWTRWTTPGMAGLLMAAGLFGVAVTAPNVPTLK